MLQRSGQALHRQDGHRRIAQCLPQRSMQAPAHVQESSQLAHVPPKLRQPGAAGKAGKQDPLKEVAVLLGNLLADGRGAFDKDNNALE